MLFKFPRQWKWQKLWVAFWPLQFSARWKPLSFQWTIISFVLFCFFSRFVPRSFNSHHYASEDWSVSWVSWVGFWVAVDGQRRAWCVLTIHKHRFILNGLGKRIQVSWKIQVWVECYLGMSDNCGCFYLSLYVQITWYTVIMHCLNTDGQQSVYYYFHINILEPVLYSSCTSKITSEVDSWTVTPHSEPWKTHTEAHWLKLRKPRPCTIDH